jgi:hypothetical protein
VLWGGGPANFKNHFETFNLEKGFETQSNRATEQKKKNNSG